MLERSIERGGLRVELGVEPAIEIDGVEHTDLDRRRVCLRWLSGTVLTGLAGATLIGASVYAALDPRSMTPEKPEIAVVERSSSRGSAPARKGDRLVKAVDIVAARQTFRTATTVRAGEREIVRNRQFTKVATNLTMSQTGLASDVPSFNPMKLMAGGPALTDAPPEIDLSRDDADVSFTTSDLTLEPSRDDGFSLSPEEIEAQVREHVRSALRGASRAPLPLPPQLLLMRTSRAGISDAAGLAYANGAESRFSTAFSSIQVRMVPENVTIAPRADSQARRDSEETLAVVRRNETLEDILKEAGASRDQIRRITGALALRRGLNEGQRLKILFTEPETGPQKLQIARLSVYSDDMIEAIVALADSGEYVSVAVTDGQMAARRKPVSSEDDEDEEESGALRLYNSFYETALKQEMPRSVIDDLVRIFANDVDFQRPVTGGDAFEAFYEESDETEGRHDLLYASITARGESFRYYRYLTPEDGLIDFYDQAGRSTRKFLIRKPISIGEQRSGFGMRRHPILRYSRMHTGVDWSAPTGTPIVASGNGTIIKAARESGYGNRVEIQHANGYVTTYNHMSGFARGISAGVRVRQGQVVGFLGSTGLSTGPHLHYEVIVNGNFVDPLRIRLARTRELTGRQVAEFRRERERIDELIARAPNAQRFAAR